MWKSEDNSGADSLLPLVSFGDQYQVSRLAQKHLSLPTESSCWLQVKTSLHTFPLLVALITGNKGETFNQIAVCLPVGSQFEGMPELFGACRLEAEAWAGILRDLRQWCTDREEAQALTEWLNEAL